jgi:ankyrin repeat protein
MQQGLSKAASAAAAQRNTSQQTPLRFKVGDRVEVRCQHISRVLPDVPRNRRGKAKVKSEWYRAVVTQLWYWEDGMPEPAPYQCELDEHQVRVFAHEDKDEIITRAGQPPHDRLLEAIEQHCNLRHLQFIVQHHRLDVQVFGDKLMRAAASACCFQAFSWLVDHCNVNANQCKGPKDRNVLHLAVMGRSPVGKPGPEEFFREIFSWDDTNRTMFDLRHLLVQQDADDQTILHLAALVGKTHPRLMEVLLDPQLEGGRILGETLKSETNFEPGTPDDPRSCYFPFTEHMETLKSYASQGFFAHSFSETISRAVFRFLQGALVDPLVFLSDSLGVDIRNYHFEEYIFKSWHGHVPDKDGDDTSSDNHWLHLGTIENDVISEWDGFDGIAHFFLTKVIKYENNPLWLRTWQWKIMQVTDDTELVKNALKRVDNLAVLRTYELSKYCIWREAPPLSRKRDMLDWLVQSKGQRISPHLFVAYQQPSLMQWACDLHYFDLDSPMGEFTSLIEHIRTLDWLPFKHPGRNKSKAPKKPALKDSEDSEYFRACSDLGDILLFLSAGYGDILTFEYLLMKRSPQRSLSSLCSIAYAGQPLLHVAARRGSAEIVKLLVARQLVQVDSFFEGVNAAHVAFSSGFRFIGQFLLNSGCSAVDLQGRDHLWHARISGLNHMTSYVESEELNARLPRCITDIDQLLALFRESSTSFDTIKTYIETCPTFTALESPVTIETRYLELLPLVVAHSFEATAYFLQLIKGGDCYRRFGGFGGPAIFELRDLLCDTFQGRESELDVDGFNPGDLDHFWFNPGTEFWLKFVLFQAQRMGKQDVVHYLSSMEHEEERKKLFRNVVFKQEELLRKGAEVVCIKENVSKLIDLKMPNNTDWKFSLIDQTGNLNRTRADDVVWGGKRGLFLVCCAEGYLHLVEWLLALDAVEGKKLQEGFKAAVEGGNLSVVSYLWDGCRSKILDSTISSSLSYAGKRGDLALVQALLQHLLDKNGDPNIAGSDEFACNVLTAAIVYYVGHSQKSVVESSFDECVADLRLLEEDVEGQDRIQILQFLMTQETIDPTKVMWNRLRRIEFHWAFNRLDLFGELRLANAVRILCARDQGSSARKLFVNLLETVSLDLYDVLTLPVLTIFAEQYNIDIQEATQPKIKFMLSQVMLVIKTYPDRTSWNLASLAELQQLTQRQRKRWQWIDQIDSVVSLQKLQTDAQV